MDSNPSISVSLGQILSLLESGDEILRLAFAHFFAADSFESFDGGLGCFWGFGRFAGVSRNPDTSEELELLGEIVDVFGRSWLSDLPEI